MLIFDRCLAQSTPFFPETMEVTHFERYVMLIYTFCIGSGYCHTERCHWKLRDVTSSASSIIIIDCAFRLFFPRRTEHITSNNKNVCGAVLYE